LRTPADWVLGALRLVGTHSKGEHRLFDSLLNRYLVCPPGDQPRSAAPVDVDIDIPSPEPLLFDDPAAAVTHLDLSESDRCCFERLQLHLVNNSAYYNRFLWLNENADARAIRFAKIPGQGDRSLLDFIENRPLAVMGNLVAFPCADVGLAARINARLRPPDRGTATEWEKLVTLPTRGVFAEAKLGHCNASEEIDNTRFWDWQTSPIPHFAPEIAPVQPVTPQPQQPDARPTPFPQSLVNIVNPPAAPDPTGLAAALGVLGTPNIFRDMSGRAEVADLLKRLSDNTIGIAEAANRAREIQQRYGAGAAGGGSGGGAAGGAGGGRPNPSQQHDQLQVLRNAEAHGDISPDFRKEKAKALLNYAIPDGGGGAPASPPTAGWPDAPTSGATTTEPGLTAPATGWNHDIVKIGRINRIPLRDLSLAAPVNDRDDEAVESSAERAIVLKPDYLASSSTAHVLLLHLHGYNIGYRQRKKKGVNPAAEIGSARDVDLDRAAQQLEAWGSVPLGEASRGAKLLAVLAQGTGDPRKAGNPSFQFGGGANGFFSNPDAYLQSILAALQQLKLLAKETVPGRVILSGHSGAGGMLSRLLVSGKVPSGLLMVILFDAINVTPEPGGDIQLQNYTKWVKDQIDKDLAYLATLPTEAEQLAFLVYSMRFRGYCSSGYKTQYDQLAAAIKSHFTAKAKVPPLASQAVRQALVDNYKITYLNHGDHDGVIGKPSSALGNKRPLEDALEAVPVP